MQDFTLIIPTYNRPKQLGALLGYLEASRSLCRILILDSSQPQPRAATRKVVEATNLKLEHVEFPSETHPFDKFREGAHKVTTEFCALCADDDLVVLDGVKRCLEALRSNPQASVAQGYSFSFFCQPNGEMDLGNILYFSSTIDDATPLARLAKLFALYQAATYGNYRTPVLQQILDTLKPMTSTLGRELLGSALAAVEGQMIRIPCFTHGRSMDASEGYQRWHPLEWFAKDVRGLFSEYQAYRDLLANAVLSRPDNNLSRAAVRRILHFIHLRYLLRHAPDEAVEFIIEQKLGLIPFSKYWSRQEIHQPLLKAACIGSFGQALPEVKSRDTDARTYNLHRNFWAPQRAPAPREDEISDLLRSLDYYHLGRVVTISVLLCNYNDATYLPESLSAICTQSLPPNEVIVLDDGSTDNSLEIIERFAERYPFIRIFKNATNRGLLYSVNRALKEARSDFIVWAAADDRLMPNFIECNARLLRQYPLAHMTFSRLAVFRDGSNEITEFTEKNHGVAFDFGSSPRFFSPEILRERLQRSYLWISANTVVASRTALMQIGGFDTELRWHADYFAFWAVALRHGACCIPETLALMRQRDQTYSSTGMAKRNEQRATLGRLADKLTRKGWRDIGIAALRCPSLLSPFGSRMLEALLLKPPRWPFAVTYGLWWASHQFGQRSGVAALIASRCARLSLQATLVGMQQAARFLHWARGR